jgi:WD40 repeat protein
MLEDKPIKRLFGVTILIFTVILFVGCRTNTSDNLQMLDREPVIDPDYSGVTVPGNIAPMNFIIREKGGHHIVKALSANGVQFSVKSKNGVVRFNLRLWRKLLKNSVGGKIKFEVYSKNTDGTVSQFKPFFMNVVDESIDPFICYRLLYPGFQAGGAMKIVQRSLESFYESSVVENQLLEDNCINCHSFRQNNPEHFLLHVRGSKKGTYFIEGNRVKRMDLRVGEMTSNAVYPSWHPFGQYVVFSSNKIVQAFHMGPDKRNEIYDLNSSLLIYSVYNNEITPCSIMDTVNTVYNETFPCWSPDGNHLYYCSTEQPKEKFDYKNIRYNLIRRSFDPGSGTFGQREVVFDADKINKSVSLPSISPDGRFVVFALSDYGTSSIWHKNADLYMLDLSTGKVSWLALNSNEAESYQSWSSNGKWIVFSSKRRDGLTARPYIAYFDSPGNMGKPFILPQKNPAVYDKMLETFNIPELITGEILVGPRDFARASERPRLKATWVGGKD